MYIRRKVFSVVKDSNGEEKYFSVAQQKEFGAHERKQNKKLIDAEKNAQMQAARSAKTQARVDKMTEILKGGGKLTGKYKDMYENGGYKADVDAALKKSGEVSQKATKHAESAVRATGRIGDVATKMANKRHSLKEGGELSLQSGNHTGGLKVKVVDQKTLGDIKGKNKKTVVKTGGKMVETQGGGKQTTQMALSKEQQAKVNSKPKVVAKGKELPAQEIKRPTQTVITKPKTEVKMETPKKTVKISTTDIKKEAPKVEAEMKKGASKLGKLGKAGIAGALAVGSGLVAAKKYKDKKKDEKAKKAALKGFSEKEIKKSDKIAIWAAKNLNTKKGRDAVIKAYDKDSQDFKPMAKRNAKVTGTTGALISIPGGVIIGKQLGGKKGAAIGGAIGAANAGAMAGLEYGATRFSGATNKELRKKSKKIDKNSQKTADISKVADGRMSKEEFAEKYGKEKKD